MSDIREWSVSGGGWLGFTVHSLNRPTLESTLNDPFREMVGLGSKTIITMVLHGRSFGTQIKLST